MKMQSMTTVVVLTMKWNDFRLKWNESDFNQTRVLNLPPSLVWKPDIVLYNNAEDRESSDEESSNRINVENNGDCVLVQPHRFVSTCNIDVTDFPFDKQVCKLRFGSWTTSQELMQMTHLQRTTNDGTYFGANHHNGGDWKVDGLVEVPTTRKHSYSSTVFSEMDYKFRVIHRPNYYILYMLLPCIVISILILLVFIIPPDAGERIGLGITVLLNMSVYLLVVADHLPQTSEQSPLLGIFYVTIMYEIAWAFIASVINLYLYHKKTAPPRWLRVLFKVDDQQKHAAETQIYKTRSDDLLQMSVYRRRGFNKQQTREYTDTTSSTDTLSVKEESRNEVVTAWQVIGRTMDFLCFWFFAALFAVTTICIVLLKPAV